MVATTRPSASRRGPVKQAALAQMTCAVLAVYALAAPVVRGSYMHAPEAKHVRTMLGCTPRVLMYPTMLDGFSDPHPLVFSRVDENLGLPRNGKQICGGGYIPVSGTGLQVCGSRNLTIEMTPEKAQVGHSFTMGIVWEYAANTLTRPGAMVGTPATGSVVQNVTGSVTIEVISPVPVFVTLHDEPSSYVFNLGCMGTAKLMARDESVALDLASSGCANSNYAIEIRAEAEGSYPTSVTGMPQGVMLPGGGLGGVPLLVAVEGDTPSSRVMEFRWEPERGQQRSTPYRVCFSAADVYGLAHVIKCITVKVQKCMYCAREGDTIASIASQYDTDWLHLYTTNPLVTNPDALPVGTRINTGVFYEVRKGDYLELLYDRFFVEESQLLGVES